MNLTLPQSVLKVLLKLPQSVRKILKAKPSMTVIKELIERKVIWKNIDYKILQLKTFQEAIIQGMAALKCAEAFQEPYMHVFLHMLDVGKESGLGQKCKLYNI